MNYCKYIFITLIIIVLPQAEGRYEEQKNEIDKLRQQLTDNLYNQQYTTEQNTIFSSSEKIGIKTDKNMFTSIKSCCGKTDLLKCAQEKPDCFGSHLKQEIACSAEMKKICYSNPEMIKSFSKINKENKDASNSVRNANVGTFIVDSTAACLEKNKNSFTDQCYTILTKRFNSVKEGVEKLKSQMKNTNRARQKAVPTATAAP